VKRDSYLLEEARRVVGILIEAPKLRGGGKDPHCGPQGRGKKRKQTGASLYVPGGADLKRIGEGLATRKILERGRILFHGKEKRSLRREKAKSLNNAGKARR